MPWLNTNLHKYLNIYRITLILFYFFSALLLYIFLFAHCVSLLLHVHCLPTCYIVLRLTRLNKFYYYYCYCYCYCYYYYYYYYSCHKNWRRNSFIFLRNVTCNSYHLTRITITCFWLNSNWLSFARSPMSSFSSSKTIAFTVSFRLLKWETPTFISLGLWLQHPVLNRVKNKICIKIQQRVCPRKIHNVNGPTLWYGMDGKALSNASSIMLQTSMCVHVKDDFISI